MQAARLGDYPHVAAVMARDDPVADIYTQFRTRPYALGGAEQLEDLRVQLLRDTPGPVSATSTNTPSPRLMAGSRIRGWELILPFACSSGETHRASAAPSMVSAKIKDPDIG